MSTATRAALLVVGLLTFARWARPNRSRASDPWANGSSQQRTVPRRGGPPSASEWAAFLDIASTEVRSGSSLIAALAHARLRHPQLAARIDSHASGPSPDPETAIAAQSVAAALELGGPVAATLHHGAALLRERAAQRDEALAHSAQARLSARVLTATPLLFATWSLATSTTFRQAITSPTGLAAAMAGLASNTIGWWWMRRIVAKATP